MLLGLSATAKAEVNDGTMIEFSTLMPLASWVEKATNVKFSFLPIAVASDRKLERALRIEDVQRAGAVGAYVPGRLMISNEVWDPDSLQAQSYVVHELVHHAQWVSGRTYACNEAKEREAYVLQSRWLTEHGQKPLVDQAFIKKMATCPAVQAD